MNDNEDDGQDIVADVFETAQLTETVERARPFLAWHRPHKQLVRMEQWCAELRRLLKEQRISRSGKTPRSLSYLSLPGEDMLDVRAVHDLCEQESVILRYLGFNAGAKTPSTDTNVSMAEVLKMPSLDPVQSTVVRDRLEMISREKSVASKTLNNYAPFDLVNLDFCDTIGNDSDASESTIDAIRQILIVQKKRRAEPWLLCLTTRANFEQAPEFYRRLWDLIHDNAMSSSLFADGLIELGVPSRPYSISELQQSQISRGVSLGIAKWLLRLAVGAAPRWKVSVQSVYAYKSFAPMDMVSMCFRFEQIIEPLKDPIYPQCVVPHAGATAATNEADALDGEVAHALPLLVGMKAFDDIDARLAADEALRRKMIDSSARLLAQARYSEVEYRQWVAQELAKS